MTTSSASRRPAFFVSSTLLLCALLAALWWFWPKTSEEAGKRPPSRASGSLTQIPSGRPGRGSFSQPSIPVRVAVASQGDFSLYYKALGTVTAQTTVNVRARVSGQLQELRFEEGQQVKAGDVLALIDPRPYRVAQQQAEGAVQESRALLRNAELDLQRYRKLHEEDSIAKQKLDTQQALVSQYQAALARQQALLAEAQLNLDFTEVRAPAAGRLGLRQVDVGNLVGSSDATPLVVITQTRPISISFTLPERDLTPVLAAFRKGEKLRVEAWDRDERQMLAVGTLHSLDNQIDTNTGTLRFKAQFDNADESLFPNQFVNVRLLAAVVKNAVLLPTAAVQYGSNGSYAFVVEGNDGGKGTVRLRNLQLGAEDGSRVVIQSGLAAGDRVVLEGVDRLRDGGLVEVVRDEGEDGVQAAQSLEDSLNEAGRAVPGA